MHRRRPDWVVGIMVLLVVRVKVHGPWEVGTKPSRQIGILPDMQHGGAAETNQLHTAEPGHRMLVYDTWSCLNYMFTELGKLHLPQMSYAPSNHAVAKRTQITLDGHLALLGDGGPLVSHYPNWQACNETLVRFYHAP
jgi:hypothetical protein